VIFAAIANWADHHEYPVNFMCRLLRVSRSGYYKWRDTPESPHSITDQHLCDLLADLWAKLNRPGVRRLHAELRALGWRVARKRVWRLMRRLHLAGRHHRAWRRTTIPGSRPVDAPDLIGRDFTAARRDTRWCGDITYVKTWDGWAYLATVIDLYSRRLVGWAIGDHMRTSLVIDALTMAVTDRRPPVGVIFHSDRGVQYTSGEFARWCRGHGVTRSLGRTGVSLLTGYSIAEPLRRHAVRGDVRSVAGAWVQHVSHDGQGSPAARAA
jgi:transposase InsO family protein